MTWLECTIQKKCVSCACAFAWAYNNEYDSAFRIFKDKFFEILFYFYNQIYWAQNDSLWESKIIIH